MYSLGVIVYVLLGGLPPEGSGDGDMSDTLKVCGGRTCLDLFSRISCRVTVLVFLHLTGTTCQRQGTVLPSARLTSKSHPTTARIL